MILLHGEADVFFGGVLGEDAAIIFFDRLGLASVTSATGHGHTAAQSVILILIGLTEGHFAFATSCSGEGLDRVWRRNCPAVRVGFDSWPANTAADGRCIVPRILIYDGLLEVANKDNGGGCFAASLTRAVQTVKSPTSWSFDALRRGGLVTVIVKFGHRRIVPGVRVHRVTVVRHGGFVVAGCSENESSMLVWKEVGRAGN